MKLAKFFAYLLCAAVTISSCRNNDDDNDPEPVPQPETLSGNISSNKKLTNDRTWVINGFVYVTAGATLTIEPGTVIKAKAGDKSALIIERGAKIVADGNSPSTPIVFTSTNEPGKRNPGDWGGIIILGAAPTNRTSEPSIEGGVGRKYGGTNADDNSGILRYVRIEYAGIAFEPNNEINALTLGGVGRGTIIDHVQVSYANDDAFEFFGGTVNAKHLVAIGTIDDDFDFDFGYTGTIQFAVSLRVPKLADAVDASNGIECDNDGTGTSAEPRTRPVLSNFTIIGPNGAAELHANHNVGNRWRRSTDFVFVNSIIMGAQKGGISVESANSMNDLMVNNKSEFKNNIIHALKSPYAVDSAAARTVTSFPADPLTAAQVTDMRTAGALALKTKLETFGNISLATADEVGLTTPFSLTAPNFMPKAGSKALEGSFVTQAGIEAVNYRGAFNSTTNWMAGWTNFDPQTKSY